MFVVVAIAFRSLVMNEDASAEVGGAMLCLETCPEASPASSAFMCMEHKLEEGLSSEVSNSSQVSESSMYEDRSCLCDDSPLDQQEKKCRSCSSYLSTTQARTGLTQSQRATLVDSMVLLTEQIGLSNDSLFMAVACLDKYLSAAPVTLPLLQPVSVACLWIASKYEELASIPAAVFAPFMVSPDGQSLGSETQAVQLLVKLEIGVLQAIDYRLASIVTTKAFKHRIIQRLWSDARTVTQLSERQQQQLYSLTSYLTEVSLLEYQLLQWPPSMLASAAYALAQLLLGFPLDNKSLMELTGYNCEDLFMVMQYLCSLHATLYQALTAGVPYSVSRKYCSSNLGCVATIPPLSAGDPRLAA